ncbi:hypothetical protein BDR07DRAFT_1415997 [Suillus spraguei]|nr:hypothetical protein BDR07DRAFT_1415997 [Suillus spraguei]
MCQIRRTIIGHVLCAPQLLCESRPVTFAWLCHVSQCICCTSFLFSNFVSRACCCSTSASVLREVPTVQRYVRIDEVWHSSGQVLYDFDKYSA